ncbi:MAG: type I glyceraldehyde-3-phosphate dehydrogenase, partial [Desulfobacterales bacterium]
MTVKIGINGFGRIGRNIFRALGKDEAFKDIEVVAINDLTNHETLAHLLKYDSIMGVYEKNVHVSAKGLTVNGTEVTIFNHRNPADIPWGDMGADYVVESTGIFTDGEKASAHIDGGAKKVVISAPAKGNVKTIVMGVNEHEYDPSEHH